MSGLSDTERSQFATVMQTIRAVGSGLEESRAEGRELADRLRLVLPRHRRGDDRPRRETRCPRPTSWRSSGSVPDATSPRSRRRRARFTPTPRSHGRATVFVDVRINAHGELTGGYLHHGLSDNLGSFVITPAGRVAR